MSNYDPSNLFHSPLMVGAESMGVLGGIGLIILGLITAEIKPIMVGTTMVTGGGAGLGYGAASRRQVPRPWDTPRYDSTAGYEQRTAERARRNLEARMRYLEAQKRDSE